jgi:hypothetical protein
VSWLLLHDKDVPLLMTEVSFRRKNHLPQGSRGKQGDAPSNILPQREATLILRESRLRQA